MLTSSFYKTMAITAGFSLLLPMSATQAREGIELGAGVAGIEFDDSYNLSDKGGLRAFGGYRFGNNWSLELQFTGSETDIERGVANGVDADFAQTYINGVYHFNGGEIVEPYISIGYGTHYIEATRATTTGGSLDLETSSTSGGLGFGLKYYFANNFYLRPEVQITRAAEYEGENYIGSLSLGYIFDTSTPAAPAPKAPAPAPVVADSDGDGVVDTSDACPATPAGVTVDSRGCELKVDSDGDGVLDGVDECPDTKAKLKVDDKGCPVKLTETVSMDVKINFATNSDVVLAQYFGEIRKVADFMNQYEGTVVEIEGHTDTRGSAAYNKNLSQKRADSVAKILVEQMGIAPSRVRAVGYGEERPVADESTKAGLLANRRVVATISTQVERLQEK